jgi:hypothetical protein
MIVIPCPSGLTIQCHPIGGKVFTSVDEANNSTGEQAIRRTFNACHAYTDDAGPYPHAEEGPSKPDWNKIHFSDLLWAMFDLREQSFPQPRSELGYINAVRGTPDDRPCGRVVEFEVSCLNGECGKLFESSVDLHDIRSTVPEWTDEVRNAINRGEDIRSETRTGEVIFWRPSMLALNKPMTDAMKRIVGPTYGTRARPEGVVEQIVKHVTKLVLPDGMDEAGKKKTKVHTDVRAVWKWFSQAPGEVLDHMLRELDTRQPTVDNDLLLTCNTCGMEQRRALPFGGTFFFPSTSQQAKRMWREKTQRDREAKAKERQDREAASSGSSSPE